MGVAILQATSSKHMLCLCLTSDSLPQKKLRLGEGRNDAKKTAEADKESQLEGPSQRVKEASRFCLSLPSQQNLWLPQGLGFTSNSGYKT